MDKKKLGLAAASLLGAATMLTASPAHADDVIICCIEEPGPGGGDPFLKLSLNFQKVTSKIVTLQGEDSTAFNKIESAFSKIFLKFDI